MIKITLKEYKELRDKIEERKIQDGNNWNNIIAFIYNTNVLILQYSYNTEHAQKRNMELNKI